MDKKKILILVLVVTYLLSFSCVAFALDFFGISITNTDKLKEAFTKVVRTEEGVSYSYREEWADPLIYCWGEVELNTISLTICNDSEVPLEMNPLFDEFLIVTPDKLAYKAQIVTDKAHYPTTISPGEEGIVQITNPTNTLDIEYILISIYGKTVIFLRKIEEPKEQGS